MKADRIQNQIKEFLAGMPCNNLIIPDCQSLRDQMNKDLSSNPGGCTSCRKAAVKRKYKQIIFNSLKNIPDAE
jgi:hypothetical protein